jgi:hypothetical protein
MNAINSHQKSRAEVVALVAAKLLARAGELAVRTGDADLGCDLVQQAGAIKAAVWVRKEGAALKAYFDSLGELPLPATARARATDPIETEATGIAGLIIQQLFAVPPAPQTPATVSRPVRHSSRQRKSARANRKPKTGGKS